MKQDFKGSQNKAMERRNRFELFRTWGPRLLAGALAGMLASIPMAGVMDGLNRILPTQKRSWLDRLRPLPPKQITASMLGRRVRQGRKWDAPTWAGHLGYGAATASLYPVLTRPLPLPDILRGMLFATIIWAGSYLGWLPAFNIMPSAVKDTPRRNAVMILSHLVWGALTGLLAGKTMNLMKGER
ncbi:MAG: hypothetical protein EHM21_18895 [Chloroflexi bacterium]|nr:MAG: hypothetical protein EHM21_18895 [Chloroflexota bacterium]